MTQLRLIALAIAGASVLALAGGAIAQRLLRPQGPSTPAWIACAAALLAPLLAGALRAAAASGHPGASGGGAPPLAFYAVLEAGVVLCAVALVVTPQPWPLLAGAVPLAVMLANLPPKAD